MTPPPRPIPWIPLILTLLWLPSGALWMANAQHFGWGFLPFLAWMVSFPILFIVFGLLAIVEHRRKDRGQARLMAWMGLSALYGTILGVWLAMHWQKFLPH